MVSRLLSKFVVKEYRSRCGFGVRWGFSDVMRRLISLSTFVPISCISLEFSSGLNSVGMKLRPRSRT